MSYQDRVDAEKKLASEEYRDPVYIQPNEGEVGEFLETGVYWGKCKKCNQFGEAVKKDGKYICVKCGT